MIKFISLIYLNSLFLIIFAEFKFEDNLIRKKWNDHKRTHNLVFGSSEEQIRYELFKARHIEIENHNELFDKGLKSYKRELNYFSHLTDKEFKNHFPTFKNRTHSNFDTKNFKIDFSKREILPDKFDWRDRVKLSLPRDQTLLKTTNCMSCWAFATASTLEIIHGMKNPGKSIQLSEQQLIDCNKCADLKCNNGCGGGMGDRAYDYVKQYGLTERKNYPYTGKDGQCKPFVANEFISNYYLIPQKERSIDTIMTALFKYPMQIAICASPELIEFKGGIYSNKKVGNQMYELNHAMTLIGWGVENGVKYWLIRNSFGPNWGENGNMRILRDDDNVAGIMTEPYVVLP